jgi:hypothetical protein
MARRMRAPVQRAAGIVILDLQMIAAGLVKINRVGEVRALRFGNLAEAILVFVRFDIFPRGFDFRVRGNAKAVVVVEGFLRRVRAAFVDDHAPGGVGMFDRRLARFALDDLHGQQVGEHRQGFVQRTTFIVTLDQADGFEHALLLVDALQIQVTFGAAHCQIVRQPRISRFNA